MDTLIARLTTAGTIIGAIVVVYGFIRFVTVGSWVGLLIAVAILIVGPLEDLLKGWVRQRARTPEEGEAHATIVDRVTSLAFLVLLAVVIAICP
jgi:CDP-diglyceride synthetase